MRQLNESAREKDNKRWLERYGAQARAQRKDKDESDDDAAPMEYRKHARYDAKRRAAVLRKCPCESGLAREWCDKCDQRGSGKAAQKLGVLAPLHGNMSDESFVALRGMSRKHFERYRRAFLQPAPPELVEALLEAQRMLGGRPVRALEDDHTYPRWKVLDDMGMELGFESVSLSDFRTSNAVHVGSKPTARRQTPPRGRCLVFVRWSRCSGRTTRARAGGGTGAGGR